MKRIFLDIETLPAAEQHREFVENTTRAKALKNGTVADAAQLAHAFDQTALRGTLGRLLCIGFLYEEDGLKKCCGAFGWDKQAQRFHLNEAQTLQSFWHYLADKGFDLRHDLLIGHNVLAFDLPFLYQRSIVHGVRPSVKFDLYPFREQPIYDTMRQWGCNNPREYFSLAELAHACGLNCPKSSGVSGENVAAFFAAHQHTEILKYCLNDVRCTRRLYYHMTYQEMMSDEKSPQMNTDGR